MNDALRIAVPVESGEGLEAVRSQHFGHAPGFVLVDIVDGAVAGITHVSNPPHTHGGCMLIVNALASHGVGAVSAAGMGPGPLGGLMTAGIAVHHDTESRTVSEAVAAILEGRTGRFTAEQACRGHHH